MATKTVKRRKTTVKKPTPKPTIAKKAIPKPKIKAICPKCKSSNLKIVKEKQREGYKKCYIVCECGADFIISQ